MKEVPPSDWTDFALCKKPGDWNRPDTFLDHRAVVMRMAEEPFPPAAAAEEERSQRRMPMFGTIRREKHVQVVAGRFGVTKLELHGLAFLHEISDGNRPRFLVRSHEIAHQKIAPFEPAAMLVDGDANV
jgi:hypothetical protein